MAETVAVLKARMALIIAVGLLLADCAPTVLQRWSPSALSPQAQEEIPAGDPASAAAGAWLEVIFHKGTPDGVRRVLPNQVAAVPLSLNPLGVYDVKVWLPESHTPGEAEKMRIVVESELWRNATSAGASWVGDEGRYIAFVLEPNGEPRTGLVSIDVQGVREAEGTSGPLHFSFQVVEREPLAAGQSLSSLPQGRSSVRDIGAFRYGQRRYDTAVLVLYALSPTDQRAAVLGIYVYGNAPADDARRYTRYWPCPREVGTIDITDVKDPTVGPDGPTGTVRFTTSSGVAGTFDMASETWAFEQAPAALGLGRLFSPFPQFTPNVEAVVG